jgi:hypothetical protein
MQQGGPKPDFSKTKVLHLSVHDNGVTAFCTTKGHGHECFRNAPTKANY